MDFGFGSTLCSVPNRQFTSVVHYREIVSLCPDAVLLQVLNSRKCWV